MQSEDDKHDDGHGHRLVSVTINDRTVSISRGDYIVANLKQKLEVPAPDLFDRLDKHNAPQPLDDHAKVEIHGGERFVSFPRTGHSS